MLVSSPCGVGSSLSHFRSKSSNCNFLLILLHVGVHLRNARGVSREAAVSLLGGVTLIAKSTVAMMKIEAKGKQKRTESVLLNTRRYYAKTCDVLSTYFKKTVGTYLSLLERQENAMVELLSQDFEDEWRYAESKNPVAVT